PIRAPQRVRLRERGQVTSRPDVAGVVYGESGAGHSTSSGVTSDADEQGVRWDRHRLWRLWCRDDHFANPLVGPQVDDLRLGTNLNVRYSRDGVDEVLGH